MKFKRLLEEKNRLEILKSRDELTQEGLEILSELTQALQLQQTGVSGSFDKLIDKFKLETDLVWYKNPNIFKEWANDR